MGQLLPIDLDAPDAALLEQALLTSLSSRLEAGPDHDLLLQELDQLQEVLDKDGPLAAPLERALLQTLRQILAADEVLVR